MGYNPDWQDFQKPALDCVGGGIHPANMPRIAAGLGLDYAGLAEKAREYRELQTALRL